jgi:hypothetical protein
VQNTGANANEIGTAVANAVRQMPIVVSVTDINTAQQMKVKVLNNGTI